MNANQKKQLGEVEPLAYVGAWLEDGHLFPTKVAHQQFKPEVGRMKRYLSDHPELVELCK